jgi:poly-beta-1,6-N-acetyl-D-glucosamine synthase
MIPWWMMALAVLGINFAIWGLVGLCRLSGAMVELMNGASPAGGRPTAPVPVPGREPRGLRGVLSAWGQECRAGAAESRRQRRRLARAAGPAVIAGDVVTVSRRLTAADVAVLIPAHNEAVVIGDSLKSIMALVPRENVHVVSDGSSDDTAQIARDAGVRVMETEVNSGKAGALQQAIEQFALIQRFPVMMLLDADTRVLPGYFEAGLAMFANPKVAAVAGCVKTARGRALSFTGNLLVCHRQRIYAIGQRVLKFGQTWMRTNATHIVPGFASMYRTCVLPSIDLNPPGLVIEDFNMTFEVYQKRLGKVGFTLGAVAVTQDPDNFHDYIRQTRRWAVGLWQTVRRHPPKANLFSAMLGLLLLELVASSLLFLVLPLVLIVLMIPELTGGLPAWPGFDLVYSAVSAHVTLTGVTLGVLLPDLALTCLAAAAERQPRLLLFVAVYPLMRLLDAAIGLSAIPVAWLRNSSSGQWRSPARRPVAVTAAHPPVAVPAGPAEGLVAAHGGAVAGAAVNGAAVNGAVVNGAAVNGAAGNGEARGGIPGSSGTPVNGEVHKRAPGNGNGMAPALSVRGSHAAG